MHSSKVIPLVTSDAGHCMTGKNWQEIGINTLAYHLSSLLIKPGYDFLMTLPNLAAYVGWSETIILNASMPKEQQGKFVLRSPFDGTRSTHSMDDVMQLVAKLAPQYVVLPIGVKHAGWQWLPESIFPFLPISDLPDESERRAYGVYLPYDAQLMQFSAFMQQVIQSKKRPCYIAGNLSLAMLQELKQYDVKFCETDKPACDALHGRLYCAEGELQIQEPIHAKKFEMISPNCRCPTCNQHFTRAYLHHLLAQTPLLCQRLLIQHNQYFLSNFIYAT
jgi:queuine tRNA-ribosyltransferase